MIPSHDQAPGPGDLRPAGAHPTFVAHRSYLIIRVENDPCARDGVVTPRRLPAITAGTRSSPPQTATDDLGTAAGQRRWPLAADQAGKTGPSRAPPPAQSLPGCSRTLADTVERHRPGATSWRYPRPRAEASKKRVPGKQLESFTAGAPASVPGIGVDAQGTRPGGRPGADRHRSMA